MHSGRRCWAGKATQLATRPRARVLSSHHFLAAPSQLAASPVCTDATLVPATIHAEDPVHLHPAPPLRTTPCFDVYLLPDPPRSFAAASFPHHLCSRTSHFRSLLQSTNDDLVPVNSTNQGRVRVVGADGGELCRCPRFVTTSMSAATHRRGYSKGCVPPRGLEILAPKSTSQVNLCPKVDSFPKVTNSRENVGRNASGERCSAPRSFGPPRGRRRGFPVARLLLPRSLPAADPSRPKLLKLRPILFSPALHLAGNVACARAKGCLSARATSARAPRLALRQGRSRQDACFPLRMGESEEDQPPAGSGEVGGADGEAVLTPEERANIWEEADVLKDQMDLAVETPPQPSTRTLNPKP